MVKTGSMGQNYCQLDYKERVRIEVGLEAKKSIRQIAKELGRNPGTISREIQNYKGGPNPRGYRADHAQAERKFIKWKTGKKNKEKSEAELQYVRDKLNEEWSPEQISGRISIECPGLSICAETIYQYVFENGLEHLLPSRRPRKRRSRDHKARRQMIPNRVGIEVRCVEANERRALGHWEADTMVSSKNTASLNTMVDRKSRFVQITKIAGMSAEITKGAIVERLKYMPEDLRKTITYDNGIENKLHEDINAELKTASYFCNPYHSWEKGSIENTNGLVRRYFPKGTDFSQITPEQVRFVENRLNDRPRKCLGFKTPREVMNESTLFSGCCS